ncbi:hypothetical protein GZ77_20760 [Endozoicomonas montiporae]|uniref:Uncharacterized protein n=2 Tax=Endozoicomonas montiporae TaxID=1027273 RepID=A0A081N350_9GAMM|nr:hypothetical protein [Endozoicomonas montiporae]AMO58167.1 hypothetical protein EZMO1_4245 [Endozoicomonas montiporae CL-33]KEQ12873.1 hypothetical protein GZ77_20760 [Endozoicomonas montiporae]
MKKTVWATGLFAALVATVAWGMPLDTERQTTAATFQDLVMQTSKTVEESESSTLTVNPDKELVEKRIFECVYADNDTTSRNRVLIRGSQSCGILEAPQELEAGTQGSQVLEAVGQRVADYVNAYLPGVHQPEKTTCFPIQSKEGDYTRLSKYIEAMTRIAPNKAIRAEQPEVVSKAEDDIKKLFGETRYAVTVHNNQLCELVLVKENAPLQSNAGRSIRGCMQSCMHGLGMFLSTGAGWTWFGIKNIALAAPGAWLFRWVPSSAWWDTTTGKILYGDFAPNVTANAGGLLGVWQYPVTRNPYTGTDFTVGDSIMSWAAGFATVYYGPVPQIMAGLGTLYTLSLGRGIARLKGTHLQQ